MHSSLSVAATNVCCSLRSQTVRAPSCMAQCSFARLCVCMRVLQRRVRIPAHYNIKYKYTCNVHASGLNVCWWITLSFFSTPRRRASETRPNHRWRRHPAAITRTWLLVLGATAAATNVFTATTCVGCRSVLDCRSDRK